MSKPCKKLFVRGKAYNLRILKRSIAIFLSMAFFFLVVSCADKSEVERKKAQQEKRRVPGMALFDHPGFASKEFKIDPVTNSVTIGDYLCEIKKSADGKSVCVKFFRSGKQIRSDCGDTSGLLATESVMSILMSPPAGTDINGDGIPEVIVRYFSESLHCCYEFGIYSLGKKLEMISLLKGVHSRFKFEDLDGDGKYEAIGRDWTFAYWDAGFADSPAPQIILRWKDGRYRLAEDLMKKPPADHNELLELAEEFRQSTVFQDESMQSLRWESVWWAVMLELIYTGNGDLAWKFCDWFWLVSDQPSMSKKYQADKKRFLAEFKKQLKKSLYGLTSRR